jgi:copper chaperone NosL
VKVLISALLSVILMACSEQSNVVHQAIEINDGDECHVCGMLINRLPGPKAQAIFDKQQVKFCSTRDMVSFFQEEENTHRVSKIFVHNMNGNNWDKPNASTYIDGKSAWYVSGSNKKGAMGPTFASFDTQQQAQSFAVEFGGQVKSFEQLGAEQHMGHGMSHSEMDHHGHH